MQFKPFDFWVQNETDPLEVVVVGTANDKGEARQNNPKVKETVSNGTYPSEQELVEQLAGFVQVLESKGVQVFRPQNIVGQSQTFVRDIALVIDGVWIKGNMKIDNRKPEYEAVSYLINGHKILMPPPEALLEGGDVVLYNEYIFVGVGERTNQAGVEFLAHHFPHKTVVPLYLVSSPDPYSHVLHLDCAFQPVGEGFAIFFENGFEKTPQAILDLFGERNLIKVSSQEMYDMNPNVFSISPKEVIVEQSFERLKNVLKNCGIEPISVPFAKISKGGGLFRCSTLPLRREKKQ